MGLAQGGVARRASVESLGDEDFPGRVPGSPRGSVSSGGGGGGGRQLVPRLCRQGSQGALPTASANHGSPTSSPSKTAMLSRTPSRDSVRRKLPAQPVSSSPTAIAVSHATPVCSTAAALAASSPCSSSMASLASLRSISEVASDDDTPLQKRRSSVSRPRTNSAHGHGHGATHTSTQGGMTTTQQSVLNQSTHQVVHQTTVRATRNGIVSSSK
ncbi:Histidinol-phosphate aminotransferase [Frankliniella fusca]|uniref:Histidinol-phosphate aminotransferase n=1 Tax=Frankliniella fusca TaxID=407009 RepID=A0AAE1HDB7_9NEOP|nr:Histidinol-phosphate aminotransferase [Frankliniella fusca]